jgi:hypothetical protein
MGVLKPGEIYFCSSENLMNPETGAIFNRVIGPVIVSRAFVFDCLSINNKSY